LAIGTGIPWQNWYAVCAYLGTDFISNKTLQP